MAEVKEVPELTPEQVAAMSEDEFDAYLDGLNEPIDIDQDEPEPAQDEPEVEPEPEPEPELAEPYRTFATQADYEADRDANINSAYNDKYKSRDELLTKIERSAKGLYTDSKNPIEDMLADLDDEAARRAGQGVEDYRTELNDRAELEQFRKERDERQSREENQKRIIEGWTRDAEELKQVVPGFDLSQAMQNPAFAQALARGVSVAQAYLMTQQQKPQERREIPQNAQTALKGTGSSQVNPATLPPKEFEAYINSLR